MSGRMDLMTPERVAAIRAQSPDAFSRPVRERAAVWACGLGFALLTAFCLWRFDFSPFRLWSGLGELSAIIAQLFPPLPGDEPREIFRAMLETEAMAILGTLLAAMISVLLSFLAAKNTFPFRLPRFGVRRFLDCLRGVDQMIWALIFVRAVGLGPLAGIMAIMISDIGTMSKLFSESIENIEMKPAEGVRSAGANRIQTLRFGIVPQVLPMFLSTTLYLFESNVRSATILGIVGAGGIGFQLSDRIRAHHWEQACFILIVILVTVACIDWLSKQLRIRLIGKRS
jgi:phosphonate transport system permease protein